MPRPESTMTTNTDGRTRVITPISIDLLGEEFLALIESQNDRRKAHDEIRQVLKVLKGMDGIRDSTNLVLNPDFVCQYLAVWRGSTLYGTIRSRLNNLGKLCTFSVLRGHTEPSEFDARPIPVPPSWDEAHPSFSQAGLTRHPRSAYPGPIPTWEEVEILAVHLKANSIPWIGGRLLSLVAAVTMGKTSLAEARNGKVHEVDTGRKTLFLAERERGRRGHQPLIHLCEPLAFIFELWLPRTHCKWLYPNLSRSGPWDFRDHQRNGPPSELKEACKAAGIRELTFRALALFGEANAARLSDPLSSPFQIAPESSFLKVNYIHIQSLRDAILPEFSAPRSRMYWTYRNTFEVLIGLPGVDSTRDLTPDCIDRFKAALKYNTDKIINYNCSNLHAVCKRAIVLGHLDIDPFVQRPGFYRPVSRKSEPVESEPARPSRRTIRHINLLAPSPALPPSAPRDSATIEDKSIDQAATIEVSTPAGVSSAPVPARRCPVELQGEGLPILLHGNPLPHMSGVAYILLHAVVEAFRQGRICTASELANLTDSERPLRLFALALERPGFEPLRKVIPSYKGRKGRSIEIIDIGLEN
jgi:hypothetical protein